MSLSTREYHYRAFWELKGDALCFHPYMIAFEFWDVHHSDVEIFDSVQSPRAFRSTEEKKPRFFAGLSVSTPGIPLLVVIVD